MTDWPRKKRKRKLPLRGAPAEEHDRLPTELSVNIGRLIKKFRKERGLTQSQLGAMLAVSYQQVQKYESGSANFRIAQLQRIANVLGVSASCFFDLESQSDLIDPFLSPQERRLLKAFRRIDSSSYRALLSSVVAVFARASRVR